MKTTHGFGLLVLGGIGLHLLGKRLNKSPGQAERIYIPDGGGGTVPPGPPGPPVFTAPQHLSLSNLFLQPGRSYKAVVNVSFPLSLAANATKVVGQAQKQGFAGVNVSESMPQGWPGSTQGDYYITGTYSGPPMAMASSHAAGQVTIVDAWLVG